MNLSNRSFSILTALLIHSNILFGQYYDLKLKEQFDYIIKDANFGSGNDGAIEYIYSTNTASRGATYGDNLGYVNDGFITLYKTTRDKAYLYEAISQFFTAMTERFEYSEFGSPEMYGWSNDAGVRATTRYQDGLVVWPMARFVHLVMVEEYTALYNEPIIDSYLNDNPGDFDTFGKVAEYISDRVQEVLDGYIYYYWDGCYVGYQCAGGFMQVPEEPGTVQHINMQSATGLACLYMGLTYNNSWLERAKRIGENWKKNIEIEDYCPGGCLSGAFYNHPVFHTNATNNAYWYYDNGWRLSQSYGSCVVFPCENVGGDFSDYTNYIEDISHGIQTMTFLHGAYKNLLMDYYDDPIFSETDMIRFRNMFTKVIYNSSDGTFHNNVNGTDSPVGDPNCSGANCYRYTVTGYMPFYQYDGADATATSPNVYDILMQHYEDEIYTNPVNAHGGGIPAYGLAHCIAAQWDKECPDLTLYKRSVTYNQDFFSKWNLTIDPSSSTYSSFTEPIISTAEFTIQPDIVSNMTAANEIVLKDGFTAQAGSVFTASIDDGLCNSEFHGLKPYSPSPAQVYHPITTTETRQPEKPAVSLVASAGENKTVWLGSPNVTDAQQQLMVMDMMGRIVFRFDHLPGQVDVQSLTTGIYLFVFSTEKGSASRKVFLK